MTDHLPHKATFISNPRIVIILVLMLAFGIRLCNSFRSPDLSLRCDEVQYDDIARNIINGHGFSRGDPPKPTAIRVPLTPYFVAAVYAIDGRHPRNVRLVQAFIDTFNCFMVFLIAILIGAGWGPGALAALAYALHPQFLDIEEHLFSETIFVTFFLLSLVVLLAEHPRRSLKLIILSGFLLGMSVLSRPTTVLFPIVVVCLFYIHDRKAGKPWKARAIAYLGIITLTMTPWVIRNAVVFRSFIPMTTFAGLSFRWSVSPFAWNPENGLDSTGIPDELNKAAREMSEVEASKFLMRDGWRIVREDPRAWCVLCVKKFLNMWFRLYRTRYPFYLRLSLALSNLGILLFAWLGAKKLKCKYVVHLLIGIFAYYSIFHIVLTSSELRYSTPAIAFMLPFTAVGFLSVLNRKSSKQAS